MRYIKIVLVLSMLFPMQGWTQEESMGRSTDKGKIYLFWGWNWGWYTKSDIHFKGDNYNFTLHGVKARDRQSEFGFDPYFHPAKITVPQTNFRIGYYINDRLDISIGDDHMKYVMVAEQKSKISGTIADSSVYSGNYNREDILLTKDFLQFEHTDGLNYINVELTYNHDLLEMLHRSTNKSVLRINGIVGFGSGMLVPKSNVTLWNRSRHDAYHLAGYGFAGKTGLNITAFRHFFIRSELKGGFIHMPDIRTSALKEDRASQHFFFAQLNFVFGFHINWLN